MLRALELFFTNNLPLFDFVFGFPNIKFLLLFA